MTAGKPPYSFLFAPIAVSLSGAAVSVALWEMLLGPSMMSTPATLLVYFGEALSGSIVAELIWWWWKIRPGASHVMREGALTTLKWWMAGSLLWFGSPVGATLAGRGVREGLVVGATLLTVCVGVASLMRRQRNNPASEHQ